jgi:hypothetical protein
MLTLLVAIVSGGLAGGVVSTIFNSVFHWRTMPTELYPKVSNMYSAYIRIDAAISSTRLRPSSIGRHRGARLPNGCIGLPV